MPDNESSVSGGFSSPSSISQDFSFKYTESGGLTARYLLISYDSKTNILASSTDITGSNITQKPINDTDKDDLKNAIAENEFFTTKTDYPPEKEDPSLTSYNLTITIGDKTHTTAWTNASKDLQGGITKIVDQIKKLVTKEKVL
jgi:hypothetical protein